MSVMLATSNPEAADRMAKSDPVPGVGEIVLYFPRPSEIRAGKQCVPALVTGSDQDNGRLDLLAIYDADDFQVRRGLPRRMGEDQGWEVRPASGVTTERFERFMDEMAAVLFGDQPKPDSGSMLEAMSDIYGRIATIEKNWELIQPLLKMGGELKPARKK